MHRFFIPGEWIHSGEVTFQEPVSRQIVRVLRIRSGEHVVVLAGGMQYEVELAQLDPEVKGRILQTQPAGGEPSLYLTLYQCLVQREKFEWILQKCTEIGVSEFVPVVSSRSLPRKKDGSQPGKTLRWERILQEAAEQSQRGRIPRLSSSLSFEQALEDARGRHSRLLIPWEGESQGKLRVVLKDIGESHPVRLACFIGPEGGFSLEEVQSARAAGAVPVSLGRRILRVETAALVTAALLMHEFGELE